MTTPLDNHRLRLDAIDDQLLQLLQERDALATEIVATKIADGLPVFAPEREQAKVAAFRQSATARGLDPEWAEDLLRMVMSSSRAGQSRAAIPQCAGGARTIVIVGGDGQLGRCYGRFFAASGHTVRVLETGDWDQVDNLVDGAEAVVVSVPIRATTAVINQLAPHLAADTLLVDFTSHKAAPLQAMLTAHGGPVLGLHPMHGPDVANLSKQLIIACPGRDPGAAQWLLDQFHLWGLRVRELDPARHDRIMHQVQGLRHFVALLHGSFMRASGLAPEDILALSSPIYRAELMMTGRIFAQDAELYADIVFADADRRDLLLRFLAHHEQLAELVRDDDKAGFSREFAAIREFFGDFAAQARTESGYLIHRLADRFSDSQSDVPDGTR
jgi:chorismate mutase/prephenate dehydrogenase